MMKTFSRAITMTFGAGILATMFASSAVAGCGDLASLQGPFKMVDPEVEARALAPRANGLDSLQRGSGGASMVGMWKFQLISKGNASHNPSIPDGALLDFGFSQWHSDGTEIINSGGHSPASGNWCIGVWGQTGFLTYELNHFPIGYDPTSGTLVNYFNVREQDTLSPSGDSYSGTFTIDAYDAMGNKADHLAGTVVATRITVDSSLPTAIPSN